MDDEFDIETWAQNNLGRMIGYAAFVLALVLFPNWASVFAEMGDFFHWVAHGSDFQQFSDARE